MKYRRLAEERNCKVCGKPFIPKVNAFLQPEKYCSKECFNRGNINNINRNNKKKRQSSDSYKFSDNIRSIVNSSLSGKIQWKESTWTDRLGYSCDQLKTHLESRWTGSMTWNNYGEWTVDHVVPASFFRFESYDDIECKACWSLPNLQPMWRGDNSRKSNYLDFSALSKVPLVLSRNLDLLQICYNLDGNLIKLRHGVNIDPKYIKLAQKAYSVT